MPTPTPRRLRRALGVAALGLALVAGASPLDLAVPQARADGAARSTVTTTADADPTLLSELNRTGDGRTTIRFEPSTGAVRFVGFPAGTAWRTAPDAPTDPPQIARVFLARYSTVFGVTPEELRPVTDRLPSAGARTLRFAQYYGELAVTGAELVVAFDESGGISTAAGKLIPTLDLAAEPTLAPARARDLAGDAARREWALDAATAVDTGTPELSVFDPGFTGRSGASEPALAWRIPVQRSGVTEARSALVFLDAASGDELAVVERVHAALDRRICDNNNRRGFPATCIDDIDRAEGDAASGTAAIDDVYDHLGAADAFLRTRFGRDGIDNAGQPYRAVVRYCAPFASSRCPYQNAYWDGDSTMVFGNGFAADDVVFHEVVHGITQNTSGLFYLDQSGAINESLSDIFGEFIDLLDPRTDSADDANPSLRWLLGERLADGAIRSLSTPPDFDQPDSLLSRAFLNVPAGTRCSSSNDYCGVHINSGVGNKAAYLIAAGGEFRGRTVTALGIPKAAAIFYSAAGLLGPLSRYRDLADALIQSCTNLTGTSPLGAGSPIAAADCAEVTDAVAATAMDTGVGVEDLPNLPPLARDRSVSAKGGRVKVNVLAGVEDPNGDEVKFGSATNGTKGKVRCTKSGVCTYTAKKKPRGADQFTYSVRDGRGGVDTGTVAVKLKAPKARAGSGVLDDEDRAFSDRGDGANQARTARAGRADLVGVARAGAVRYAEGSALRTGDIRVRRSGGRVQAITGTGTFGPGLRITFNLEVSDGRAFGDIVVRHPRSGFVDRIPVDGDRISIDGRQVRGDVQWRQRGKAIPVQRMVFIVRDRRR